MLIVQHKAILIVLDVFLAKTVTHAFPLCVQEQDGSFQDAFDIKIEELHIVAIEFLKGTRKPTIALIYEQAGKLRVRMPLMLIVP